MMNHCKLKSLVCGLIVLTAISCSSTKMQQQASRNAKNRVRTKSVDAVYRLQIKDIRQFGISDFHDLDNGYLVNKFYDARDYKPAWFINGEITENGSDFLKELDNAESEGLYPGNYNYYHIVADLQKYQALSEVGVRYPELAVHVDVMLTSAYLSYAYDLLNGSLNPGKPGLTWETIPGNIDLSILLDEALKKNKISASLRLLKPVDMQYLELREKFNVMQQIAGGLKQSLPGEVSYLSKNDTSKAVADIKQFLLLTGDLVVDNEKYLSSPVFDGLLETAVKKYQLRHNLEPDGIIGRRTFDSMKMYPDERLDQIRLNLDRLRWLPENLGDEFILINLPDYSLEYYVKDKLMMKMKVIIGEIENYTPVLKDTLRFIVFNPPWNVPRSIATEEILPKVKNDSTYLERRNFLLMQGSYRGDTINPDSVDWEKMTEENFPYYIVQKSGDFNALGKVKFIFPNTHSIYLHDTPADYLFEADERDFSHGCVRLEKPFQLAKALLRNNEMSPDSIDNIIQGDTTLTFYLPRDVPVHFTYLTAFVKNGVLNFRDDIYHFDKIDIPLMKPFADKRKSEYWLEEFLDKE